MFSSVLGHDRNLLWFGATAAEAAIYAVPRVCWAVWSRAKVFLLYCVEPTVPLRLPFKNRISIRVVFLHLGYIIHNISYALARLNVVDMHLGLAVFCVGLPGYGVDLGVRFLFRSCLFLLGFGTSLGLHLLGNLHLLGSGFCYRELCRGLFGGLCFGFRGGFNLCGLL